MGLPVFGKSSSYCSRFQYLGQKLNWKVFPLEDVQVPLAGCGVKIAPAGCILDGHDGFLQVTEQGHREILNCSSTVMLFQQLRLIGLLPKKSSTPIACRYSEVRVWLRKAADEFSRACRVLPSEQGTDVSLVHFKPFHSTMTHCRPAPILLPEDDSVHLATETYPGNISKQFPRKPAHAVLKGRDDLGHILLTSLTSL